MPFTLSTALKRDFKVIEHSIKRKRQTSLFDISQFPSNIYIHVCACVCVERERERKGERGREREMEGEKRKREFLHKISLILTMKKYFA